MGSSQRLAAVAAISAAHHYRNHTSRSDVLQTETTNYNVNIFFVSATLCGVLVAVCAACWRRSTGYDKPDDVTECHGVYTISVDSRLSQEQIEMPGPPPAYDTVVHKTSDHKDCRTLQEVVTEPCPKCQAEPSQCDGGLPSYEAAVMLRDTKL